MRLDKKLLLHDSEQNRKDNLEKGLKVLNFLQDLKMDNLLGRVGGKELPVETLNTMDIFSKGGLNFKKFLYICTQSLH